MMLYQLKQTLCLHDFFFHLGGFNITDTFKKSIPPVPIGMGYDKQAIEYAVKSFKDGLEALDRVRVN
jgi:hypothetical protein